jgi:hypothetical protein
MRFNPASNQVPQVWRMAWHDKKGPSLRFQSISVGERSDVKGMVSPPGVSVRKGASIEKLSVVPEGAEVSYLKSLCGGFEIALVGV